MQLSSIKIAGFKSFVDPTTINLPSKLVAIVGPNGCGKSNIIDAVTWVMGESSPKYLRGESLTDVIFNGSNGRKPVGQASVELVFDNSDGTIGGEYSNFAEISVKRSINRESDSSYFLNGVRCRKRDIVDIFLGTGLGPRSYSIVGQNMITRMIEAKPDELRTYIEEAAGISKYKERRHETELRIGHTKENLSRINDLRTELEKQLSHLKHQANVAEKFKTLKQQERVLRAELLSIQWRQLDSHMVEHTLNIQREETAFEAKNSELIGTDKDLEHLRHEQRVAQDAFQEVQRRYYAVGNEITRIEQEVLHHEERQTQWENDLNQVDADWQSVKDQMSEAEDNLCELERDIQQVEPKVSSITQEVQALKQTLIGAEESVQKGQVQWDEFNTLAAKTSQTMQVEKNHIQHIEQRIEFLTKRLQQLNQENENVNFSDLNQEVEEFSRKSAEVADRLDHEGKALENVRKEMATVQIAIQTSSTSLDQTRSELQRLLGVQSSLNALQQTALGQRDNPISSWIAKYQLDNKPRLAQNIRVEKGWELAVETALGLNLKAICIDKIDDIVPHLSDFKSGNLSVFTTQKSTSLTQQARKGTLLLEKVNSSWPLESVMSGIYVADDLNHALSLCETLADNESVMTRDGIWLGRSWLKVMRDEDPAAGVFQREQELKELITRIDALKSTQESLEQRIEQHRQQLQLLEQQRDELQQSYSQQQAQAAQINAQQKMKQERLAELTKQSERLIKDQQDCNQQLTQAQSEIVESRERLEKAINESAQHTHIREQLLQTRDQARQHLSTVRENETRLRQALHEHEIRLQTAKSQKASYGQSMARLQHQLSSLSERKIALQSELSSMPPMDTLKKSLSRALDKHVSIESELNTTRVAMEALDQEFRNLEDKRQILEKEINKVRSSLEALRVEMQGWRVKSDTILEQLKETEFTLEAVLKELTEQANVEEWQAKLDQTVQRINRLGPINLVAIDEYATCSERKQYIDKQHDDLVEGLATLEEAISKIDKETKVKFKETFDTVNNRFQELFPTIFGGGKAYLELNSEDLLEAGITMMACPPGKRNSSIYLLSGGEKSLTAIALIFSIFYLNPAPFCLLDEVDAALDDMNVTRFTRLVKTMADKTQFIFISHNKITIETGEHLIGVTMNEPGVSRLVSVDIEKAMSLADAS